ncbi:aldehyde dehydrogenase family protein [Mycobacterium ulcerans str. Harvey]|uniref:Putative succinate-semialdehyde dehydrogenase [NADP(+)] 2 n=1 Tax=Mycobacterium ulcerans str. Harvey TaxID=1299332 RepID=A0ABN0QKU6_MYCUL|nr:aldehyde dehydrogenase family protein [Mycobacterium ulcerans str. Harvey]
MIVLADADIERAANHAAYYSMFNCGQTCISIERCYVEAPVYDEFVARSPKRCVRSARAYPPAPAASTSVTDLPPQVETVQRHVEEAVERGAKVLTGGHRGRTKGTGMNRRCWSTSPRHGLHARGDFGRRCRS